jgi:hypothetical protein
MSEENAQNSAFVQESMQTLTDPKTYFSEMPVSGGFGAPVVKALLYGVIAGIISFIWNLLGIPTMGGLSSILGDSAGLMALIMSIIGALIWLFIGGLIILIFSAIAGGSTDYEANVRVTAALMVLTPVTALFGFVYSFSHFLGALIALLINLYGVWMYLQALNGVLKAKAGTAKVIAVIIAVIYIFFFFTGLAASKIADNLSSAADNPEQVEGMAKKIAETVGGEELAEQVEKEMSKAEGYHLETAAGTDIQSPTLMQVIKAVGELGNDNDFAILSKGDYYLQTGFSDKGYTVEYRDADGHFQASELATQTQVATMFRYFLKGDDSWKNLAKWEPAE